MCTHAWNAPDKQKQSSAAVICGHLLCDELVHTKKCAQNAKHFQRTTATRDITLTREILIYFVGVSWHTLLWRHVIKSQENKLTTCIPKPCYVVNFFHPKCARSGSLLLACRPCQSSWLPLVFLWFDQVSDIFMEHFLPELHVYNDAAYIFALCLKVCGNNMDYLNALDRRWTTWILPASTSLIYLHAFGIKAEWPSIPHQQRTSSTARRWHFCNPWTYNLLMAWMIDLVKTFLKLPKPEFKAGLQRVPWRTGWVATFTQLVNSLLLVLIAIGCINTAIW